MNAIDVALLRADQCMEVHDFENARRAYEYAVGACPECLDAVEGLADLLLHEFGDVEGAQIMYERALVLAPNSGPEKFFNYGELLSHTYPHRAEGVYLQGIAVAVLPNDAKATAEAFVALAELYLDTLSDKDRASQSCEAYLLRAHDAFSSAGILSAELERVKAMAAHKNGELEKAQGHALRCVEYLEETKEEDLPTFGARMDLVKVLIACRQLETAWHLALDLHVSDAANIDVFEILAEIRLLDNDPRHAMDILRYCSDSLEGSDVSAAMASVAHQMQSLAMEYDYEAPLTYDPLS